VRPSGDCNRKGVQEVEARHRRLVQVPLCGGENCRQSILRLHLLRRNTDDLIIPWASTLSCYCRVMTSVLFHCPVPTDRTILSGPRRLLARRSQSRGSLAQSKGMASRLPRLRGTRETNARFLLGGIMGRLIIRRLGTVGASGLGPPSSTAAAEGLRSLSPTVRKCQVRSLAHDLDGVFCEPLRDNESHGQRYSAVSNRMAPHRLVNNAGITGPMGRR